MRSLKNFDQHHITIRRCKNCFIYSRFRDDFDMFPDFRRIGYCVECDNYICKNCFGEYCEDCSFKFLLEFESKDTNNENT